jgi:ubiquinone/menaquinone biosynthesis C-methylase UbiE
MTGGNKIAIETVNCPRCGATEAQLIATTRDFCYSTCDDEFGYVRCDSCGQLYLRNRPAVSELGIIYPKTYLSNDYRKNLGDAIASVREWVQSKRLDPARRFVQTGDAVVDIGAGSGDLLALWRSKRGPALRLFGVDISEGCIEQMRARGIDPILGRIEEIDWKGPPAAVVTMFQLIEHVARPSETLAKVRDILRPGGALLLETPSSESWDARIVAPRYWAGWHAPRHWTVFDEKGLCRLLEEAGFEIVSVKYTLSPFIWLHTFQYWLQERVGVPKIARYIDVWNPIALVGACVLDVIQLAVRRRTSNMQILARKL